MENYEIVFGFAAILGIVFTFFHFSIEKLTTYKWFVNLKIERANLEISAGLVYGIGALLVTVLTWSVAPDLTIIIGLVSSVMTVIWRTWIAAIIVAVPSTVFGALVNPITLLTYWQIGVTFGSILICYLVYQLKPARYKGFQLSAVHAFVLLLSWLIYALVENKVNDPLTLKTTLGFGGASLIAASIIGLLVGWVVSANLLARSTTFAFNNYYRYPVAEALIQNQITKEKPVLGVYTIFEFVSPTNDKAKRNSELSSVYQAIKKLNDKSTLFSITQTTFGAFIPVSKLQTIAQEAAKELGANFEAVATKNSRFIFGYAFYNLDSASFNDLERFADHALRVSKVYKAGVSRYNYATDQKSMQEFNDLKAMDEKIQLDNFELLFNGVIMKDSSKPSIFASRIENITEFESETALQTFLELNNWTETFERYFALAAIERLSARPDAKVIVKYDLLNHKSVDFRDLVARIMSFNVNPSQVVLAAHVKNESVLSANLNAATKFGIQTALINPPKPFAQKFRNAWVLVKARKKSLQIAYNNKVIIINIDTPQLLLEAQKNQAWGKAGRALHESPQLN